MCNCKAILCSLACILFSITGMVSYGLSALSDVGSQPMLVWGGKDNLGKYTIHLSRHLGDQWSSPVILSSGDRLSILPAVSSDGQATICVAWTELQGVYGMIRFSYFVNEEWSAPATLQTQTVSDMAPSVAISADGTAWLVYSGSDGIQDDIYSVHWTGKKWSRPAKINSDDERPDILPDITIAASGQPVVTWQGYNGDQYVTYSSYWDGSNWSAEEEVPARNVLSGKNNYAAFADDKRKVLLQNLPEFITDTSQAVFFHYRDGKGETIKLKKHR